MPPVLTPESVETALRDRPLAATWRAMNGKLASGEFSKMGLSLYDQQQQLARRDELVRQRDELKNKLLVLEKELGQ